jgi:DNA-binding NarL/FixJ family response regulator
MHVFNKRTNLILQTKKRAKKLPVKRFRTMIFLYGISLAALIGIMKFVEYRYFIRDFSIEVYVGVVAALFTGLGIWVGLKLINRKNKVETIEFVKDEKALKSLKISKREYQVLQLISKGLSNQEIADELFISLPTVKTHSSNLFEKLDVQRRTQAIHKAKELKLIP